MCFSYGQTKTETKIISKINRQILSNKVLKKEIDEQNRNWIAFSEGVSRGAPKAVLGDNNYLKFLDEFDFSRFIQN